MVGVTYQETMMLRRSLLTAAAATITLPAARIAQACSNPPIGRYEPEQAYGDCGETWVGNQYPEYYAAINTINMIAGKTPMPPGTRRISGFDDPWFQAQLRGGEYADLSDLRDLMVYGGAIGGSYGLRRGGSRGAAVGAVLGAEAAAIMWFGYNMGVIGQRLGIIPTSVQTSYNGWAGQQYYPQGTFGIPFGMGEWFAVDFNMFGGGGGASPWCVRLY